VCHYCGCRQIPLIRDYIAEHELVVELGSRAIEEADRGALADAQATVAQMRAELVSHWQGEEEDGILPVTLVEFSGPEWDAAIAAWERAHPGRTVDVH
jgi:hypothetical protein